MSPGRAFALAISLLAACAAVFGAFFGWVVYAMAQSADGNYDGTVSTATTVQFILGWVGIAPVLVMAYFVFRGRNHQAVAALIAGVIVWAGWAILNDAAVHGWRDSFFLSFF
ncbi:MAG TPA: hypothetical protein VIE64_05630 [Solirubrobacterales bacterium]|jgi:heme/copper-type cytochrome/quinol oxidase subunit 2